MKNTIDVVKKLQDYFGVLIIGSYLLIEEGLDNDLVSDIDISVFSKDPKIKNIRNFLKDNNFIETRSYDNPPGYQATQGSLIFNNSEYDKPIHISIIKEINNWYVMDIADIISSKYKRKSPSDIKQLKNIMDKL